MREGVFMLPLLDLFSPKETLREIEEFLLTSLQEVRAMDAEADKERATTLDGAKPPPRTAAAGVPQNLIGSSPWRSFSKSPFLFVVDPVLKGPSGSKDEKRPSWFDSLKKFGETHPDIADTGKLFFLGFFPYAYLPYKIGSKLCSSDTPLCLYQGAMKYLEEMIPDSLIEAFRAPPRPKELRKLEISEEEINSMVTKALSKGGSMVKDIHVHLQEGVIKISGKADLGILDADLRARIRFGVKDGKTEGAIEELTVGGAGIPTAITNYLLQQLKSQGIHVPKEPNLEDLSWLEIDDVKNLEILDGKVILEKEVPI
jgi:hypothetical protein